MKNRMILVRACLITMLAAAILSVPTVSYAADKVALTVSLDKEEYTADEPINATFILTNKGKKEIYVNTRFQVNHPKESPKGHREISLAVTGPSGKIEYKASYYETGLPKTDLFVLLKPKEKAESERPKNIKGYFELKEPGEYKITATYQNVHGKEIGLNAFKKKIKSKPVVIKIVEKKKEEE